MGLKVKTLYCLSSLIILISLVLYIVGAGFGALFSIPLDLEDSIFFIMKISLILGLFTEYVKWSKQKDSKIAVTLSWIVLIVGVIAHLFIVSSSLETITFSLLAVGLVSLVSFIGNLFD